MCTLYSELVKTTDWCFCSLETCVVFFAPFSHGCKNPLACGGHPVGRRKLILLGLFVLDQQATCVCFFVFFFISLHFRLVVFIGVLTCFMAVVTLQHIHNSFIWDSFSPPTPLHLIINGLQCAGGGILEVTDRFFLKIWFMRMGQMFLFLILMCCLLCTVSHPLRLTSSAAMQLFNT